MRGKDLGAECMTIKGAISAEGGSLQLCRFVRHQKTEVRTLLLECPKLSF